LFDRARQGEEESKPLEHPQCLSDPVGVVFAGAWWCGWVGQDSREREGITKIGGKQRSMNRAMSGW
jgi:hypothetical protein